MAKKEDLFVDAQCGMGDLDTQLTIQGLCKMSKEIKDSIVTISKDEARYLIDSYYQVQQLRINSDGAIRAIVQAADDQSEKIPLAMKWTSLNMRNQEDQLKKMLESYCMHKPVGKWALSITGVGPVIAAGCLAYFDINKVSHYGQFMSFAGLNDYNNPWLGKEGANKLTKKIYEDLKESDAEIIYDRANTDYIKEKLSALRNMDRYGTGMINTICSNDIILKEMFESVLSQTEDIDRTEDYIIRNFCDPNAVTEYVITEVAVSTNRRREVVVNGLKGVISSKKTTKSTDKTPEKKTKGRKKSSAYGIWTKTDLSSYLAKPPWSAKAKQLAYKLGESFEMQSGREKSLYGRLYRERKVYETVQNEEGKYADQAAQILQKKNYGKDTESYKCYIKGMLPPEHIRRRSKRYAVRIFLSHLFEAMYADKYHCRPPFEIYPIAHQGHTDYIPPEVPIEKYIDII